MGAFFPKTRALFPISEKGQARPLPHTAPPPHSSYVPVPVLLKISVGAVKLFIKNN